MKKNNSLGRFHLINQDKTMILNFHNFKQQFSDQLMRNQPYQQADLFNVERCFHQGISDTIDLIAKLYDSGKLELTFKTAPVVGINNISDYRRECIINDEVDLDEFEYPLLSRYYYSGVRQILDLLNRDFKVKYKV